ncbi:hypothetical protein P171DRAFT_488774 [Karstenula rhodostoma CBS 690.94]|uniref:Uncharacterized protein n=1 Tax=Karstenula rhodostoma CBS 690.94 TaxID=1392251 RepID=A0A9P4U8H0_9PLEO|nr:hypothetical protein P171DRAFT_488774 [Karstenula rhodostoma CBS 690.94]
MNSRSCKLKKKKWRQEFFKSRALNQQSFIQKRREIGRDADELDTFLCDNESSTSSPSYKVITGFCYQPDLALDKNLVSPTSAISARAWIDIRSHSDHHQLSHTGWHDPVHLEELLNKVGYLCSPQFCTTANKIRRRKIVIELLRAVSYSIYIPNLDRRFILALARTALHYQVGAIRDALYKHIAFKASMRVEIPIRGFPTFRLEFSIPRLTLIENPSMARRGRQFSNEKATVYPNNTLPDIAFLNVGASDSLKPTLEASHFTLTIIGWDHYKWSAFAFANRGSPFEDTKDEEEQEEENDLGPDDHMDAIAGGSDDDNVLAADQPIWDPRTYWLVTVEKYVKQSAEEWCKLVYHIEASFTNWKNKFNIWSLSFGPTRSMHEVFEWNMRALGLLSDLVQRLAIVVETIHRFLIPGGDGDYFLDLTDDSAIQALHCIDKHLSSLSEQKDTLRSLSSGCTQATKIISLYMDQENSRINLESSRLSREANALGLHTLRIAKYQNRMALASNLNATLMLSTNQIMTPVVVVTAYYSTQDQIFGFARNSTSFVIAVLIIYLALKVANILTVLARRFIRSNRLLTLVALGHLDRLAEMGKESDLITPASFV